MSKKQLAFCIVISLIAIVAFMDLTNMLSGCTLINLAEDQFSGFIRSFFGNIRQ